MHSTTVCIYKRLDVLLLDHRKNGREATEKQKQTKGNKTMNFHSLPSYDLVFYYQFYYNGLL